MHPMTRNKENPLEPGCRHIELVNKAHPEFEETLAKSPGIHPFDIEDFMDDVKDPETIVKLRRFGFFQAIEQKVHSEDQILTVEEIKPGMTVFLRQNDEVVGEITIISEPHRDDGEWKVDYEEIGRDEERQYLYLCDNGVAQYQNGLWNAWNWLQKPDNLVAILKDKAGENLEALQEIFDDYFEGGYGSSLPQEKRSVVSNGARNLVLAWTRGRLAENGVIDRNHISSAGDLYRNLEQELGIESYSEIASSLESLSLTGYQKAGLKRRIWNLAEKALKKAKQD
jgi:hypothetical protein